MEVIGASNLSRRYFIGSLLAAPIVGSKVFADAPSKAATYQITSHIDNPGDFKALGATSYFTVNTPVPFQIARYKNEKFGPAYNASDMENPDTCPFPQNTNGDACAVIDPGFSGHPCGCRVYRGHEGCPHYENGDFCLHFDPEIKSSTLSPLVEIPKYTYVSGPYTQAIHNAVESLPKEISNFLFRENFKVVIGYNPEDSYYKMFRELETHDLQLTRDLSKKSYIRLSNGKWISQVKYSEATGVFFENKALIPERHYKYGTKELIVMDAAWAKEALFHEVGHKLDWYKGQTGVLLKYSDNDEFKKAVKEDRSKMTNEEQEWQIAPLLKKEDKAFAEICGVLMGGFREERAKLVLNRFPKSAQYVAKVLKDVYKFSTKIDLARMKVSEDELNRIARRNSERWMLAPLGLAA